MSGVRKYVRQACFLALYPKVTADTVIIIKNDLVIKVRIIPLLITIKNKASVFGSKLNSSGSRALWYSRLYYYITIIVFCVFKAWMNLHSHSSWEDMGFSTWQGAFHRIKKSKNGWGWKGPLGPPGPILLQPGHLQQVAQEQDQMAFEDL